MESIIEAEDWNGFRFRKATVEDSELIAQLLRTCYYPDEPITKLVGFSEEYENDFRKIWSTFFKDNLSFLVTDIASQKIAGVRFIFNNTKDVDFSKLDFRSPQTTIVFNCLKNLDKDLDIHQKYNIDKFANMFITCVNPEFRNRGLVTEMYKRAIRLSRHEGFFLATANFSSPFSRKAAANAGFEQTAIVKFVDMKNDDGSPLIPQATPEQSFSRAIYIL